MLPSHMFWSLGTAESEIGRLEGRIATCIVCAMVQGLGTPQRCGTGRMLPRAKHTRTAEPRCPQSRNTHTRHSTLTPFRA